ncbi:hypothetical protein OESDEN_06534 [Oesophagostomum dentatum]|uniref:Uncharacterized protein n=1 Tax=Oesophagostomum dentatum TaxID=61180 RepID=A0A0B1TBP2_OESDE|nr:hypothetical protein OESDEN_06534 [Oesophagostomum dentatum]
MVAGHHLLMALPGINPGGGGPGGWNPNGVYPPLGNGLYPTPDGSGGYGEPYGGSDSYPFRDGEGDIRVRKFSPPYIGDDYDDEDFVDRLKKTMQSAINEAVGKQLYQDRVPVQDYKADFVRLKLKYHPIKCSAVFTESAVYNKNQRYRSSGYKCLVHHRKVVGICATSCPPANVGKCCNSNKDAYIQSVPNKYSKLAVKLLIQYPLLRQWPKKKWSYVLSKAMELLQDGKYKRAFSKASFDFD